MKFERKLKPNKMEAEAVFFCWLRFHSPAPNSFFIITDDGL